MTEKYFRFTKEGLPKTPRDLVWEDDKGEKHIVGTIKDFDVDDAGNVLMRSVLIDTEKVNKLGINQSVEHFSIGFDHDVVNISPVLKQAARYGEQLSHLYHTRKHDEMFAIDDAWHQFRQQVMGFDPEYHRQTIDKFMESYRETTKKYRETTS